MKMFDPSQLSPGVYTVAQAAQRLGVTERTAHKWIARGEFPVPVLRLGGRTRVSIAVLERYLDGTTS